MTTLLLDTHVVHWLAAEPHLLSRRANEAVQAADEYAVASVSWFELAWIAHRGRITVDVPLRAWLEGLASNVRTVATTPQIAATAAALPNSFPGDHADRVIYAMAIETSWNLVTRDERLRRHRGPRALTIW